MKDNCILDAGAVIQASGGLTEVLAATRDTVLEIQAWAQEPPSDELPKLIEELTTALGNLQHVVMAYGERIEAMPDRVAARLKAAGVPAGP